jgi:ribonuclease P protein component
MARARAEPGKSATPGLKTLKRRAEFLRVRKGARWAGPLFVLEARPRTTEAGTRPADGAETGARFGFTVTRQVGKAVERNRIRRRLKAAVREVGARHARAEFDYVVIARRPALTSEFGAIRSDLVKAFERVNRAPARGR